MRPPPIGLQAERTRLAWRRMTLSTTAVILLAIVAVGVRGPSPLALAAVSVMAGGWLAMLALAHRRINHLSRSTTTSGWPPLALAGFITVALAALSCFIVFSTRA